MTLTLNTSWPSICYSCLVILHQANHTDGPSSLWQANQRDGQGDARAGQHVVRPGCERGGLAAFWCTAGSRRSCYMTRSSSCILNECVQMCHSQSVVPLWGLKRMRHIGVAQSWSSLSLLRCWRTSGPVSWSKWPRFRSRNIRSGSSSCTRICRNPPTAAKLSESVGKYGQNCHFDSAPNGSPAVPGQHWLHLHDPQPCCFSHD